MCYNHRWHIVLLGNVYLSLLFIICIFTVTLCLFFSLAFFPCFFSLAFFPSLLVRFIFFLHILVTKENMNTPELNIQESVISSMTPYKGTQILLFFLFFPLLSLSVSYSKRNNQKLHQYKYIRMTSMASITSIKVCYNFEAF